MKHKLNILERLLLLKIFRNLESDFTTLKIVRDLQSELSFTEQEHKDFNFGVAENGGVKWETQKTDTPKAIEFGEIAQDIIKKQLNTLDKEKKLTMDFFSLYEKFLGEKNAND